MLTIGMFVEHYDPFVSGVVSSVKNYKQELERLGHTVYIVCPEVPGYYDNDPTIIRLPARHLSSVENGTLVIPNSSLFAKLRSLDLDIVHSHDVLWVSLLGIYVARKQSIPYVQSYHTLWDQLLKQYKMMTFLAYASGAVVYPYFFGLRKTLDLYGLGDSTIPKKGVAKYAWNHMLTMGKEAAVVITPSEHLRRTLHDFGMNRPIVRLPNTVTRTRLSKNILPPPKEGVLRIVSASRLSPEKRVEVTIRATALAGNCELILIGDGPQRKKLELLTSRLGVTSRTSFLGQLSNRDTRQIMRESDVLLLASHNFDNQPMVVLEAIEAGLPVVYCDPRLREGLTLKNSFCVGMQPHDFAGALRQLQNPVLRKTMSRAAAKEAKNYDISTLTKQLEEVYHKALTEPLIIKRPLRSKLVEMLQFD